MPIQDEPVVGAFYEDSEGVTFEVTGFDEDDGAIEVRYDDGAVGEIDIDAWYEMELRRLKGDGEWAGEDEEDERPARANGADDDEEEDDEDDDEE